MCLLYEFVLSAGCPDVAQYLSNGRCVDKCAAGLTWNSDSQACGECVVQCVVFYMHLG